MKIKPIGKKAQLNNLSMGILTLVIATFIIVLGYIMVQELRDTAIVNQAHTTTTNLENVTGLNITVAQNLAGVVVPGANSFTVTAVHNGSNFADVLTVENYTATSDGTIILTEGSTAGYNQTTLAVNYSFSHGGTVWEQTNVSLTGIGTFSDFWQIIVLAIVIGVILTILISTFLGRRGGR